MEEPHELLRCKEGLTLETSASEPLNGGQFTARLIKPKYLVIPPPTQHQFLWRLTPFYIKTFLTVMKIHFNIQDKPFSEATEVPPYNENSNNLGTPQRVGFRVCTIFHKTKLKINDCENRLFTCCTRCKS